MTSGPSTAYFPQIFAAVLLIGFGAAEAFTPLLTIALAGVPAKDAGIGSGIVNVSQQVSGALSVAVLGAVSAAHTSSLLASGSSPMDALDGGYRLAFVVALISVLVAIVLGAFILHRPDTAPEVEAEDVRGRVRDDDRRDHVTRPWAPGGGATVG